MKKEEKIALIKPHTTQTHAEKKKQSKPSHNIEEEKTRNNLANFSNDPHSHIHRRKASPTNKPSNMGGNK